MTYIKRCDEAISDAATPCPAQVLSGVVVNPYAEGAWIREGGGKPRGSKSQNLE